jgi:hypothetical protein
MLALLAILLAAPAMPPPQPLLVFKGNLVLFDDVYRSFLDLPADTAATAANARTVALRLRRFLRKAGYELARVSAHVEGAQIVVEIDEGQLDKIVFVGASVVEVLRLKLELNMPERVFNRPELERQLQRIAGRKHAASFAYELVPVDVPGKSLGPQLDELWSIDNLPIFQAGRPYELHILVTAGPYHTGLLPEIEINSIEGGGIGATYNGGSLLPRPGEERVEELPGSDELDRWHASGRIAGAIQQRLDTHVTHVAFTRAFVDLGWDGPVFSQWLRPTLRGRADLSDRQRPDLLVESAKFLTIEAGTELVGTPLTQLRLSIGLGFQRRWLFAIHPIAGSLVDTAAIAQTRPYGETRLTSVLNPGTIRRDRLHELDLDMRLYGRATDARSSTLRLVGRYQKMVPIGWHEFWIEGHGAYLSGDVLFPEEESLGGVLRGPFSSVYARKVVGVGAELRVSLLRDLFKVGIYDNVASYGGIDRLTNLESFRIADSIGLGVHALIIDEFALDVWIGQGFNSSGNTDTGIALTLRQAY